MKTIYDAEIEEWICICEAGRFFGNTAAEAEAQAREALRVQSEHARKQVQR